jgi:PadR family transcriptional regulator
VFMRVNSKCAHQVRPPFGRDVRTLARCSLGPQSPRGRARLKLALNLIRVISCRKLRILGMGRKAHKNDSLPGSLDMLILRTLSLRNLHGYGIVQFIQQSSANELLVEEGSLYPALQRLELHGWIDGIWGVTSNNRRARIYKITAAGRKQLAFETRKYSRLTLAIARVMGGA